MWLSAHAFVNSASPRGFGEFEFNPNVNTTSGICFDCKFLVLGKYGVIEIEIEICC